jgi:thiol-disulfide isomerase/thioredoxin
MSHVFRSYNFYQFEIVQTDKNGVFEIPLTKQGPIEYTFCGLNHLPKIVSFEVLDSTKPIEINVQLQHYVYEKDVQELSIIGGFNDYDFEKAETMTNIGDGKFTYKLSNFTSDTLKYQVLGMVNRPEARSINGTQADYYALDLGGDYYSVLVSPSRNFEITYETSKLNYVESVAKVTFVDEIYSKQYALTSKLKQLEQSARMHFSRAIQTQAMEKVSDEYFNLSQEYLDLIAQQDILQSKDKATTEYMRYLTYLGYFSERPKVTLTPVLEMINRTPPESGKVKEFGYDLIGIAKHQGIAPHEHEYILAVIEKNPDKAFAAEMLNSLIGSIIRTDEKTGLKLYDRIVKEFPDEEATKRARQEYDPNRAMQVGRKIPDFKFKSIDNPDQIISPETLKGKYVLIDLWATWCGPCIMEMENLHETYEAYKGKGFEILSISVDPMASRVVGFRNGKWKMPWLNVWSEGQFQSEAAKLFEVTGIPRFVLINPDGEIIAVDTIRGEGLKAKLAELLN